MSDEPEITIDYTQPGERLDDKALMDLLGETIKKALPRASYYIQIVETVDSRAKAQNALYLRGEHNDPAMIQGMVRSCVTTLREHAAQMAAAQPGNAH